MKMCHDDIVRIYTMIGNLGLSIPLNEKAWVGSGLPPVGVEFEYRYGGRDWETGEALYVGEIYIILKSHHCGEQHYYVRDMQFRPVRTPEQIAADERLRGIADIKIIADSAIAKSESASVAVYDAGYRKVIQ